MHLAGKSGDEVFSAASVLPGYGESVYGIMTYLLSLPLWERGFKRGDGIPLERG